MSEQNEKNDDFKFKTGMIGMLIVMGVIGWYIIYGKPAQQAKQASATEQKWNKVEPVVRLTSEGSLEVRDATTEEYRRAIVDIAKELIELKQAVAEFNKSQADKANATQQPKPANEPTAEPK